MMGNVSITDLDADGTAEVIIQRYSGGAHCCTNTVVYRWHNNTFEKTETGPLDHKGGTFEDLDGDGKIEFVSSDNKFNYAFSSYAGSYPPTAIFNYKDGELQPTTMKYPKKLREKLEKMYQTFREYQSEGLSANGILAGYVAQKILLGEFEEGWNFMVANQDRTKDKIFAGKRMGKNSDFPTELRSLLIERGYLDGNGKPTNTSP